MMQNDQTAKSARAEYILDHALVLDELNGLVNDCWTDAYGDQFELYKMQNILPHEKFGKIPIFTEMMDIIFTSINSDYRILLTFINDHFDGGIFANLYYRFVPPFNLTLRFILNDELITGSNKTFTLISHVQISDYRSPSNFIVEAFTQPIIDCEEEVSKSLLWHELSR
jgi:hypothetical protein